MLFIECSPYGVVLLKLTHQKTKIEPMATYSRNSIELKSKLYSRHIKAMASNLTRFDFNHVIPVPSSLPESVETEDLYGLANHIAGLGLANDQLQDLIKPIENFLTAQSIAPYQAEFTKMAAEGDLTALTAKGAEMHANLVNYGTITAYEWRLANWNTVNSFAVQIKRNKVGFMTLWGSALPVITQWAKKERLSLTYKCFSSASHQWFVAEFQDGDMLSIRHNQADDMRPLLKEMFGYSDADIDSLYGKLS